ncbi:RDD family protein [Colwellia sp. Arc7-635]|nr:RDD family protein [Colwellia sp. Arc7-635]
MDKFNNNVEQAGQAPTHVSSNKNSVNNEDVDNDFAKAALTLAASVAVSQSDCDSYNCWQTLTTDLFIAYAEQSPTAKQIEAFKQSLMANVTEESALNKQQVEQLNAQLQKSLANYSAKHLAKKNETNEHKIDTSEISNATNNGAQDSVSNEGKNKSRAEDSSNATVYKGFAWLQGLIEDLGIGFGWAAFYFTMFTALWHGQTPGKKLFHIRVIQLDGTPLSIWDSFGRYGGYGAGIATGLLGFAQIYWDPNRQAIHDKISATIVVNDNDNNRASGHL